MPAYLSLSQIYQEKTLNSEGGEGGRKAPLGRGRHMGVRKGCSGAGLTIGSRVDIVTAALRRQVAVPAGWKDDCLALLSWRRGDHPRLLLKKKTRVRHICHFHNCFEPQNHFEITQVR